MMRRVQTHTNTQACSIVSFLNILWWNHGPIILSETITWGRYWVSSSLIRELGDYFRKCIIQYKLVCQDSFKLLNDSDLFRKNVKFNFDLDLTNIQCFGDLWFTIHIFSSTKSKWCKFSERWELFSSSPRSIFPAYYFQKHIFTGLYFRVICIKYTSIN